MKKKVVLSINLALLFAFFVGVLGVESDASAVTPKSGESGDCVYEMDEEGNLVVRPKEGTECTLASMGNNNTSAPWNGFRNSISTVSIDGTVKTGESARGLFFDLRNATNIDLTGLDTSGTTNMQAMFRNCRSVTELDVSMLDTSHVTDMREMFYSENKLESLDLSNFDTSNVTDMYEMFYNNLELKSIDVSSFDTPKVTNMHGMFWHLPKLTGIDLTSFDTSNVVDFGRFLAESFTETKEISYLDVSNISTASAEDMVAMFGNGNYTIKQIKIGNDLKLKPKEGIGASFGRGMYQNVETGEIYPAVQLSEGGMAGTYKKISDVSDEFTADYSVDFRIEKPNRIGSFSTTREDIFSIVNDRMVFAKIPLETVDEYELPGEFTVVYDDIVSDIDGNKYDFKMTFSNMKFFDRKAQEGISDVFTMITSVSETGIGLAANTYPTIESYLNGDRALAVNGGDDSKSYDIAISIVDDEGNPVEGSYIFSIFDLDGSSYRDGGSEYKDLLYPQRGYGYYSEGVYLRDGFELGTLKKSEYSDLLILDEGRRITGKSVDNYSERSEFMIKANAADSRITWTTGDGMNSAILNHYQPEMIEIINLNEEDRKVLPGAKLELYRGDALVESWDSEEQGKKLWVMPGMYTLKVVSAPDGYEVVTDEIVFFVDAEKGIVIDDQVVERVEALDRVPEKQPDEDDKEPDDGKEDDDQEEDGKEDDGKEEGEDEDGEPEEVVVPDTGSYTGAGNGTAFSGSVIVAIVTMVVSAVTFKALRKNKN